MRTPQKAQNVLPDRGNIVGRIVFILGWGGGGGSQAKNSFELDNLKVRVEGFGFRVYGFRFSFILRGVTGLPSLRQVADDEEADLSQSLAVDEAPCCETAPGRVWGLGLRA